MDIEGSIRGCYLTPLLSSCHHSSFFGRWRHLWTAPKRCWGPKRNPPTCSVFVEIIGKWANFVPQFCWLQWVRILLESPTAARIIKKQNAFQIISSELVSINGKLVIPRIGWVKPSPISIVHAHHLGLDLTLQNARSIYWCPEMKLHIKNAVEGCQACARHQRLSLELPWMRPTRFTSALCERQPRQ